MTGKIDSDEVALDPADRAAQQRAECTHEHTVPDSNGNGVCPNCGVETFSMHPATEIVHLIGRERAAHAPNPNAQSLLDELANRIDGASLDAKLSNDEWRVWTKLSTMIRQVLRGPDLIEPASTAQVPGSMPKHAFARAERNSGSQWNGPPEETCWFCGTDPRNVIHEVPSIPIENLYDHVAIAFHIPREVAKEKLLRALYTKPPGEDHESQATRDRVHDPRDDKPDNG